MNLNAVTKLTYDEFLQLPEEEGKHYEFDRGKLVMEPSPTFRHNRIRDRIARALSEFVETQGLGEITIETGFRLSPEVVRIPDIAFVTAQQMQCFDIDRSPIEGSPALAVEVVSPGNAAEDVLLKVHQYLDSGCHAVWVVYPKMRLITIHDAKGCREVAAPNALQEKTLLGGITFSLPLEDIFG